MPGPGRKKLDRGTSDNGLPYEDPSMGSEQRVTQILAMPVPAGSTKRRDDLMRFFSSVSMTEAARLYSKLSNTGDKLRILMGSRLKRSTVPKLLGILGERSGRQTANPVPDRMTDDTLKNEFLTITERPIDSSKTSTSVEDVYDEARTGELLEELGTRGLAYTVPDPDVQEKMDQDLRLHEATQKFDYSGIDLDYLKSMFTKPPTTNLGGTAIGYYRVLEELSNGQLYEVSEASVKALPIASYTGPETIVAPYVDKKAKVLAVRYPTQMQMKDMGEIKKHVWEIWWFADETNEFKALLSRAEQAAKFNPSLDARFFIGGELERTLRIQLGILMRPLLGDLMLFDQMKREAIGAAVSGGSNRLAQKGAQKILNRGRPPGSGDVGDAGTSGKKKVDLSKPGAFKPVAFFPGMTRKLGLSVRERDFLIDNAQTYHKEMEQRAHIKNARDQSNDAHVATEKAVLGRWPDAVKERDALTGVTGPGNVGPRQADTALRLPNPPSGKPARDIVVDFKKTAFVVTPSRTLYSAGYDKLNKIETGQIQAYELAARTLGLRVFIINERGEVFTPDLNRRSGWSRVAARSDSEGASDI